ncbi:carboxypeptidase-like regulatory domain-containing protein [Paraflavitalea speifideaquila]|uniref:carboxypeptidase-like regulatory domain-containing protein n=1 Tax=Paraflavitalea speifideaquila TaxID=3076558 RepID=UPI0033130233
MQAQEVIITGIISDSKNEPLQGVSIKIKGTDRGVTTNERGFFSLPSRINDVLKFPP